MLGPIDQAVFIKVMKLYMLIQQVMQPPSESEKLKFKRA